MNNKKVAGFIHFLFFISYYLLLNPILPHVMIDMLPGGPAPLLFGELAGNGMFPVYYIGFGKTVHHAEQVGFFLVEIFG